MGEMASLMTSAWAKRCVLFACLSISRARAERTKPHCRVGRPRRDGLVSPAARAAWSARNAPTVSSTIRDMLTLRSRASALSAAISSSASLVLVCGRGFRWAMGPPHTTEQNRPIAARASTRPVHPGHDEIDQGPGLDHDGRPEVERRRDYGAAVPADDLGARAFDRAGGVARPAGRDAPLLLGGADHPERDRVEEPGRPVGDDLAR